MSPMKFFTIFSFTMVSLYHHIVNATHPHEIFEKLDSFSTQLKATSLPSRILVIHGQLGEYVKTLPSFEILTRPDAATLALKDQNTNLFSENRDLQSRIIVLENENGTLRLTLMQAQAHEDMLQEKLREAITTLDESCAELELQLNLKTQYIIGLQKALEDKNAAFELLEEVNHTLENQNQILLKTLEEKEEKQAPKMPKKKKAKAAKPPSSPTTTPKPGFPPSSPVKNPEPFTPGKPFMPKARSNPFGNSDEAAPNFPDDFNRSEPKPQGLKYFGIFISGKDCTRPALFATAGLAGVYCLRNFIKDMPSPMNPLVDLSVTILSGYLTPDTHYGWKPF